ncbi:hypothetical protein GCM10027615_49560 [Plantactinospora veratri]
MKLLGSTTASAGESGASAKAVPVATVASASAPVQNLDRQPGRRPGWRTRPALMVGDIDVPFCRRPQPLDPTWWGWGSPRHRCGGCEVRRRHRAKRIGIDVAELLKH